MQSFNWIGDWFWLSVYWLQLELAARRRSGVWYGLRWLWFCWRWSRRLTEFFMTLVRNSLSFTKFGLYYSSTLCVNSSSRFADCCCSESRSWPMVDFWLWNSLCIYINCFMPLAYSLSDYLPLRLFCSRPCITYAHKVCYFWSCMGTEDCGIWPSCILFIYPEKFRWVSSGAAGKFECWEKPAGEELRLERPWSIFIVGGIFKLIFYSDFSSLIA